MSVESRQLSLTCPFVAPFPALQRGPFSPGTGSRAGAGSSGERPACAGGMNTASHGADAGVCPAALSAAVSASGSAWCLPESDSVPTLSRCKCVRAGVNSSALRVSSGGECGADLWVFLQPSSRHLMISRVQDTRVLRSPWEQQPGPCTTEAPAAVPSHGWTRGAHGSRTCRGLDMAGICAQWPGSRAILCSFIRNIASAWLPTTPYNDTDHQLPSHHL